MQLLSALNYIHNNKIAHLDLKLQNIMFKTHKLDSIVLLDFGISKIEKEDASTDIIGLSLRYCSPEVSIGKKLKISAKSDIFSFAMFFFY